MFTALNAPQIQQLLVSLLTTEQLLTRALSALEPADFHTTCERPHALLWSVVRDHYRNYHTMPAPGVIRMEAQARVEADPDWRTDMFNRNVLEELLTALETCPPINDPRYTLGLLQQFIDQRKLLPLLPHQVLDIAAAVQRVAETYARTRLTLSTSVDVLDIDRPAMQAPPPLQCTTHFEPIDYLLHGGPVRGQLIGLLGPIGGGKTLTAIQTAVYAAAASQRVLYLTYEQRVDREISDRIMIGTTGVDRDEIERKTPNQMSTATQQKWAEARQKLGDRLRAMDMLSDEDGLGFQGVAGVETIIQNEILAGRQPDAVIIDWVGEMANGVMVTAEEADPKLKTQVIQQIAHQCRALAKKHNIWMVLCHQLNAEAGSRSEVATLGVYDSSDCKLFPALMDECIALNQAEAETGRVKISTVKSRSGSRAHCWCQIDCRRHQLRMLRDEYERVFEGDRPVLQARGSLGRTITGTPAFGVAVPERLPAA